jgi:hypothetical protein
MKKKKSKPKKSLVARTLRVSYGKKTINLFLDKLIVFRMMRSLHGRFWGVAGLSIMLLGLIVCLLIRPDMLMLSTAFSDFGRDVRTAPYLAVSLFFGAYGLWRWRNYLRRTLRHARPVTTLVTITVGGFYVAALMPIAWEPWPYRLHVIGVAVAGMSMALTVVVDTLLTRTRRNKNMLLWRCIRFCSFMLIVVGGYITFGSNSRINWFQLTLLGELMMFAGYSVWVIDKTYRGEGARSRLSRLLNKVVLID